MNTKLLHLLLLLLLQIKAVLTHGEPVWIIGYTMVIDTDNTALTWWGIFWLSILLTCSPGLWLWIHTQLFWKVWRRKRLPLCPRTASWWSHEIIREKSDTCQHAATGQAERQQRLNKVNNYASESWMILMYCNTALWWWTWYPALNGLLYSELRIIILLLVIVVCCHCI